MLITPREFVRLAGEAAGTRGRLRTAPAWAARAAGAVVPLARELAELAYQVDRPFVVDWSRYAAGSCDDAATPHAAAVAVTARWFAGTSEAAAVR